MLVNMKEIMEYANANNCAVPCFNTPNFDIVRAVVDAAEELNSPLIIAHASAHDPMIPMELIGPFMVEYAKESSMPVCVHLDHGSDMEFVLRAIRTGFTSLMYDCSRLPYEENIEELTRLCEIAHPLGYTVEAELGVMPSNGAENIGNVSPDVKENYYTNADVAADFVQKTKVDALAVCIGTVHGFYDQSPKLDIERLKEIRAKVDPECSLVLHGSSGVEFAELKKAIRAGIRKINYYTYLSIQVAPMLAREIAKNPERTYYHELTACAYELLKESAKKVITEFRDQD